ncbi:hydroxymethylglutaryl-CoA lyase [Ammoniphilus sp. CFH 90114]|uniref:hydroxymethylglutaryl-CoA lyase n=1 Tax=Ammoniphilus sp. CFH 90114 TaxID=2493665 RepID=UPI00100E70C8|nr:hydroxymethylglutaryl-CoA lyase [Ammoniphilus sp. CFH 90114]RXT14991.1 hydroxymethylglutaryl-CoA lyase [Ammoniphilus sp. CFH 90114]
MVEQVRVIEVGPRDGLQNEKKFIQTKDKIQLISLLARSGLSHIEATSFVHPKWIPQLSDAAEVARQLPFIEGVHYSALVPNRKGLIGARDAGLKEIAVFMSASESHNIKNINKTIQDTLPVIQQVVMEAATLGMRIRGYVSTVFGCPYEGQVAVESVLQVTKELLDMGVYEVSLGDTIGVATPKQVKEILSVILQSFPKEKLAMHFHDTRGTGLANVYASLEAGLRNFDSSIGGLGGCPYALGATGNISTEDLVYMMERMGVHTGINLEKLVEAGAFIQKRLGKPLPSKVLAATIAMNRGD